MVTSATPHAVAAGSGAGIQPIPSSQGSSTARVRAFSGSTVRPGLSRALFAAWSCATVAVSQAHAQLHGLGAQAASPNVLELELPPADIPSDLIHREFTRRVLDTVVGDDAPKIIVPTPPKRPRSTHVSCSHALRYKADGSTRAMDVYVYSNKNDREAIDLVNADPSFVQSLGRTQCEEEAACRQKPTEILDAPDVRVEVYNHLATPDVLPRFIEERTRPSIAFVPPDYALDLAIKVGPEALRTIPLGGESRAGHYVVPREHIDAEVANHGVIHRCVEFVAAFDSSLWSRHSRLAMLSYMRDAGITCVDFPIENGVALDVANITTCVPNTRANLRVLFAFAPDYGHHMKIYLSRQLRKDSTASASGAAPGPETHATPALSDEWIPDLIRDLIAQGVQVDLGADELQALERDRQEDAARITHGALAGLALGSTVLAARKLMALHASHKKQKATREARRLFKDMLTALAAARARAGGTAGAPVGTQPARGLDPGTVQGGTPNDAADQMTVRRSEQRTHQQERLARRHLREQQRQQEREQEQGPPEPRTPEPARSLQTPSRAGGTALATRPYPHLTRKLASALATLTAEMPRDLAAQLEACAEALDRMGDYDNAQACLHAIEDAGGIAFGDGGGGHGRRKHHGLQEVYEISAHAFSTHKKSKSLETKETALRWWAWNLLNGMPHRWRPRGMVG